MAEKKKSLKISIVGQNKMKGALRSVERSLNRTVGQVTKFSTSMVTSVGKVTAAVGAASAAFAAWQLKKQTQEVIQVTATYEQLMMTLEMVEGSAEMAGKSMQQIMKYARISPSTTEDVVRTFVQLKSILGDVELSTVKTLDSISMAFGRTIGDVSAAYIGLETEVLRRMGVTLDRTGQKAILMSGDMRLETEKTTEAIRAGLLHIWETKFPDAIDRATKTWKGMTSAFKSLIWETRLAIGRAGLLEFFERFISRISGAYVKAFDTGVIERWGQKISDILVSIFEKPMSLIVGMFEDLTSGDSIIISSVIDLFNAVKPAIKDFAESLLTVTEVFIEMGKSLFGSFKSVIEVFGDTKDNYNTVLAPVLNIIGKSLLMVGNSARLAKEGFIILTEAGKMVWNSLKSLFDKLMEKMWGFTADMRQLLLDTLKMYRDTVLEIGKNPILYATIFGDEPQALMEMTEPLNNAIKFIHKWQKDAADTTAKFAGKYKKNSDKAIENLAEIGRATDRWNEIVMDFAKGWVDLDRVVAKVDIKSTGAFEKMAETMSTLREKVSGIGAEITLSLGNKSKEAAEDAAKSIGIVNDHLADFLAGTKKGTPLLAFRAELPQGVIGGQMTAAEAQIKSMTNAVATHYRETLEKAKDTITDIERLMHFEKMAENMGVTIARPLNVMYANAEKLYKIGVINLDQFSQVIAEKVMPQVKELSETEFFKLNDKLQEAYLTLVNKVEPALSGFDATVSIPFGLPDPSVVKESISAIRKVIQRANYDATVVGETIRSQIIDRMAAFTPEARIKLFSEKDLEFFEKWKTWEPPEKTKETFDMIVMQAQNASQSVQSAFSDSLYYALYSETERMKDVWDSFNKSMVRMFSDTVVQGIEQLIKEMLKSEAVKQLSKSVMNWMSSLGSPAPNISPSLYMANGGVLKNAQLAFAQAGGIFDRPTIAAIAERPGMHEAVVPLPGNRHIPVDLRGQQQPQQTVYNVHINAVDAASFTQMLQRNPEAIVNIVNEDTMSNGASRATRREYG